MVDTHCHILFGIDDGSQDLKTSAQMIKVFMQNNVHKVIATPHFLYYSQFDEFLQARQKRYELLCEFIQRLGIDFQLYPGAEVAANDSMLRFAHLDKLTLNHSRYLLLELPFVISERQKIFEYVDYVFDCGLVPVIAHPERYEYTLKDYDIINRLCDKGCLFQLNAGSTIGHFGRRAQALSNSMIDAGIADLLATDAHRPEGRRSPELEKMLGQMKKSVSPEQKKRMTVTLPELILDNQTLPEKQYGSIRKKLFMP